MNQELKSFQWKESRRIPRSQILLVFLIPLLIYATLYILGMLLLSLELFVLAIFSSLFALIGTYFTKNQIIYRVEIIGFNVHIEIFDNRIENEEHLQMVKSIQQNRFLRNVNIKTSFNIEDLNEIQEDNKRKRVTFILKDQSIIELCSDGIDEKVLKEMIAALSI